MATKSPIECPVCHELMSPSQEIEQHLIRSHQKRELAKFVVAEVVAMEGQDISE